MKEQSHYFTANIYFDFAKKFDSLSTEKEFQKVVEELNPAENISVNIGLQPENVEIDDISFDVNKKEIHIIYCDSIYFYAKDDDDAEERVNRMFEELQEPNYLPVEYLDEEINFDIQDFGFDDIDNAEEL